MTSLNPVFTVGHQIGEVLRTHVGVSRRPPGIARSNCSSSSGSRPPSAGSATTRTTLRRYAPARDDRDGRRLRSKVLIADEPTTALDVTIQAGILDAAAWTPGRLGTSIVLITHDLGVVADLADRVAVMYAGRASRQPSTDLFANPQHPYTTGLIIAAAGRHAETHRHNEIPGLVPVLGTARRLHLRRPLPAGTRHLYDVPARTDRWSAPGRVLESSQRTSGGLVRAQPSPWKSKIWL